MKGAIFPISDELGVKLKVIHAGDWFIAALRGHR